jgi:hypothetical protein
MNLRGCRDLLLCSVLLSSVCFGAGARAESGVTADGGSSAAAHAKRGQTAYDLEDWGTAAREYEAAYRLEQRSEYLWALAQTRRLGGKCGEAIRTYRAFQRAGVSPTQANAAEMMITTCEAELAKQEARQAAEALAAPETPPASAPAAAEQPVEQSQPEASGGLGVGYFIVGATLTAGLGAAVIWSGLDTLNEQKSYEAQPTREAYQEVESREMRTNILIGAASGAAIATAVIALLTDWSSSPGTTREPHGLALRPVVVARGGGLLLSGGL